MASTPPSFPIETSSLPTSPRSLSLTDSYSTPPRLESIIENVKADHGQYYQKPPIVTSISFKGFSEDSEPGPRPKPKSRQSSPPPACRYREHVSFDNFFGGEATDKNTVSFTLNAKHLGYQFKRRSRTFMVGVDENSYSDIALYWTLEELVDDGDEIICLRVIDKDSKITTDRSLERKQYQQEARELMDSIQRRNNDDRAVSIVLEFATGKIHTTFQRMIQIYEPAMLIVGTRGRSLGGFQGLVSNRNSFSKWCLQYSPIPVVVVRPTEKRLKKKLKREEDPSRRDYARLLKDSGIESHETMVLGSAGDILEASNDPTSEAYAVADAIGLPARFNLLKPGQLEGSRTLKKVESGKTETTDGSPSPESRPVSPDLKSPNSTQLDSPALSGDEDSDEDEGEFEAIPGDILVDNGDELPEAAKKLKLHEMEVAEANALARSANRKGSIASVESNASGATSAVAEEEENKVEEGKEDDKTVEDAESQPN